MFEHWGFITAGVSTLLHYSEDWLIKMIIAAKKKQEQFPGHLGISPRAEFSILENL